MALEVWMFLNTVPVAICCVHKHFIDKFIRHNMWRGDEYKHLYHNYSLGWNHTRGGFLFCLGCTCFHNKLLCSEATEQIEEVLNDITLLYPDYLPLEVVALIGKWEFVMLINYEIPNNNNLKYSIM